MPRPLSGTGQGTSLADVLEQRRGHGDRLGGLVARSGRQRRPEAGGVGVAPEGGQELAPVGERDQHAPHGGRGDGGLAGGGEVSHAFLLFLRRMYYEAWILDGLGLAIAHCKLHAMG